VPRCEALCGLSLPWIILGNKEKVRHAINCGNSRCFGLVERAASVARSDVVLHGD